MNSSKVVNVQNRDVRGHLNRVYDLYSSRIVKIERDYIESTYRRRRTSVSCQCNIRRDLMCTCGKLASPETKYFSSPKQVYRYSDWRNYTDVGIGSIKALPRKRIRKIYLPETIDRAVGSADFTSYINRRSRQQWPGSYYEKKQTSSKCVGGFIENENVSFLSKKLSPIVQKTSATTSPRSEILRLRDINIRSNDLSKHKTSFHTQINTNDINVTSEPRQETLGKKQSSHTSKQTLEVEMPRDLSTVADTLKPPAVNDNAETCKDYSSDSFIQHVHNLEIPSDNKQSKLSVDLMENKLEREYRKIFTTKSKEKPSVDKPMSDFKSASVLRRRFEALRRGLCKKESKKDSVIINKIPSQTSMPSRKDVSIASDPPSLEGRSYSNTKVYSPIQSITNECKPQPKISNKTTSKFKKLKDSSQWSSELGDNKCESVQGMFKLWGKKFNLDEDYDKTSPPPISNDVSRSPDEVSKSESPPQVELQKKKQGRKFFIFGKKPKDKENKPYKSKKGVTAGRCEVKDGLTIKVGCTNEYNVKEPIKRQEKQLEKYEDILYKPWLNKYITNTRDSRNSVHIRWNNKMYATSSSTVLELMDSVYKHTGIDFRSRSEITTGESSDYRSYTKQRVHFMQQDIEAWMIPKTIRTKQQKQIMSDRVHYNGKSCQRWFVDATKGFSQKIELVLHSKPNSKSSEYIIINIPEGYFSQSNNELRAQSSDERIYKIVEYDTSELQKIKDTKHIPSGDSFTDSKKDNVSVRNIAEKENKGTNNQEDVIHNSNIKCSSLLRDVAIQGSDVFVPKRCNVIGVGIITQRDIRDIRKPVLKIKDDISDDDSEENLSIQQKKCELAESYLQDDCRNWMPSGIDMFSWRVRDSQLQSSENNSVASLNQGDVSKSYPSVYDNFQESTIVLSSCETSSCSHCIALEDEKKPDESIKTKFLSKFRKKGSEAPMISDKRNRPKDSIEVYKRRQFYACTNQKCKWFNDDNEIRSLPNVECKAKTGDYLKFNKPCWKLPDDTKNKKRIKEKRVSLPGCEAMSRLIDKLSDKTLEGILSYKGSEHKKGFRSPKRTEVTPNPLCEIPQPPCKESCEQEKKPPCSKKNAPSCDDLLLKPPVEPNVPVPPYKIKPVSPPQTPPLYVEPANRPPCAACKNSRKISKETLHQQKNYLSKSCSQESGVSLKMSPNPKSSDACFPTSPKESKKKIKECKPNCANKNKTINKVFNTPPTPTPTIHIPQSSTDCIKDSKEKITGLHLKKLPSKKRTSIDDCYNNDSPGVIRLDSKEKFTVRMKKDTPSTEEIREFINIKVKDEDGQTLFERIDYKQSSDANKCLLLKDVYKDPHIQRASTPTILQDVTPLKKSQNELPDDKSDTSIENLIEINFTLKLKQGDRGTEVNIKNAGDEDVRQKKEVQATESQKEIYIIQNQAEPDSILTGNKNDVNIKIVIKNYKNDADKWNETETSRAHNTGNEDFTKRISEKFQTVSTGYSDTDQNAYSIHRTTVDVTSADVRCHIQDKPNTCITSNESINVPKKLITSSQSLIERSVTKQTVNSMKSNNEEISIGSRKKSSTNSVWNFPEISHDQTSIFNDEKSDKYSILESKNYTVDETSDESVSQKNITLRTRAEKKEMLKKLFRSSSAVKKPENKKKVKQIIHAILTSDSSGTEIAVTSNELAKELTYASLDPGYFRDTDSMNNYYKLDSDMSTCELSRNQRMNPTIDNSELSDHDSNVSFVDSKKQECLCSTLATKLNVILTGGSNYCGCSCGKTVKKDEEINCDIGTNHYLSSLKNYIDVETQNSKHVSNKINSANISIRSNTQSVVIANTSATIQKSAKDEHSTVKCKSSKPFLSDYNDINRYRMKRLNRETFVGLSDDEMIVLNSKTVQKTISKCKRRSTPKRVDSKHAAVDILQLNETKKAVLEIYAKKIVSDEGEKIVAKLPKFHIEKEYDISNYENMVNGHKKISKRNFVMMTINR